MQFTSVIQTTIMATNQIFSLEDSLKVIKVGKSRDEYRRSWKEFVKFFCVLGDSVYNEPGHNEPGHYEPGHYEPGHYEPGHNEPRHNKRGKNGRTLQFQLLSDQ